MIYLKPITEISWNDIENFCQQRIPEGAYLDYKEDFPSRLEKTISSMANTYGGIILIGIEEDNDNKPILPIRGIEFQRGLSEKITNIILTNITPPIFPEIQVCKDSTENQAAIVIRIPQSHQTPHAISNNKRVYLRTGDINHPEELATIEDIGWLSDNRNKSIELRDRLFLQAESRYRSFYQMVIRSLESQKIEAQETTTGLLTLSSCPSYPRVSYLNPPQLSNILQQISIPDYYRTARTFPPRNTLASIDSSTLVQDGIVLTNYSSHAERVLYTEINSFGLYFYRQPIRREQGSIEGGQREILRASEVLARMDEFVDSANKLYKQIGYWGYLDIKIELTEISEIGFFIDWLQRAFDLPAGFSPDKEVIFSETILAGELEEEKDQLLFNAVQKISWAFGINFNRSFLDAFEKGVKKA